MSSADLQSSWIPGVVNGQPISSPNHVLAYGTAQLISDGFSYDTWWIPISGMTAGSLSPKSSIVVNQNNTTSGGRIKYAFPYSGSDNQQYIQVGFTQSVDVGTTYLSWAVFNNDNPIVSTALPVTSPTPVPTPSYLYTGTASLTTVPSTLRYYIPTSLPPNTLTDDAVILVNLNTLGVSLGGNKMSLFGSKPYSSATVQYIAVYFANNPALVATTYIVSWTVLATTSTPIVATLV